MAAIETVVQNAKDGVRGVLQGSFKGLAAPLFLTTARGRYAHFEKRVISSISEDSGEQIGLSWGYLAHLGIAAQAVFSGYGLLYLAITGTSNVFDYCYGRYRL